MLTVRTSENTVITSFRLITERQDFSSVRTGENTVRARARIQGVYREMSTESQKGPVDQQICFGRVMVGARLLSSEGATKSE